MNDDLGKYYELLGVSPGASGQELKQAYRDMAKVWHPDRFSHDPRLQQKAQEKLKEINEAYEHLTSGGAGRRSRPAPRPSEAYAPPAAHAPRRHARVILPTAVVFCGVFLAALYALVPPGARRAQPRTPPAGQESRPAEERDQPDGGAAPDSPAAPQPARGKERTPRQPAAESSSGGAPGAGPDASQLRPLPTVTVTVDAVTGLLATRDCPTVGRMTYPAGAEPQQYCGVAHRTKVVAQDEASRRNGSRLKSVAKRLASPSKWLGGEGGAREGEARDARQPGGGPQDR